MRRNFFDIIGPILIGLSISYHVSAVWIGNGSLYILSYKPVIHYNFVSIALEDIFYDVVDYDEWNDTNY